MDITLKPLPRPKELPPDHERSQVDENCFADCHKPETLAVSWMWNPTAGGRGLDQ